MSATRAALFTRSNERSGLPVAALLALAMTGLIAITTETLPSGLLPQISAGLHVSQQWAGQLVSVYALGSLLAAIPLVAATQGWQRRTALLTTIVGFFVFNTLTVFAPTITLALAARFFAGVAAGLGWGIIAGYARRMTPKALQGRGMALAMVGTPIALSIGTPTGTWMGLLIGWRYAFGVMSVLSLALIIWVLLAVPDYPGQTADERVGVAKVLIRPGVRPILLTVLGWMLAHNILYTYIAPFLGRSGLGNRVDTALLVFGLAAIPGIGLSAVVVDRALRAAVLASLAVFALAALVLGMAGTSPAWVWSALALWGLTFGGAATLVQTALADAAGNGVDPAQALMTTTWNLAIAGGGLIGGLLLGWPGVASFPWVLMALITAALAVAWRSRSHGFKPGPRT